MKLFLKIKRGIGLIGLIAIVHLGLSGQGYQVSKKGAPLESVDLIVLENIEDQLLIAKNRTLKAKEGPLTFAIPIKTNIEAQENGTWEQLDNGMLLWRQRIRSNDAYSLNLAFQDFVLPSSAAMFLYDRAKTYIIGPITQEDNEVHQEWWSPIMPFEEVVVEIQVSPKEVDLIKTTITSVQHDFQGFGALLSGSCNVDVVCGSEDGLGIIDQYRDNIINSVGMYSINGRELCSGSLINNTRNDCTPYFLTAKHCDISSNNAASVVVYWNYQQTACRPPGSAASGGVGNGPRTEFNSGASLLAEFDRSDFALILLDDPVGAAANAYFAGWDRRTTPIDSSVSVHHPDATEKRISFDFDPPIFFVENVFVQIEDWDIGTTEEGSSGAPLFTTDGLIIGQLNGGNAACGNDEFDDYGMIAVSWDGGGTPETSLRSWLDPDNSDVMTMQGRGCSDFVGASPSTIVFCSLNSRLGNTEISILNGYEEGASLTVLSAPEGVNAMLSAVVLNEDPTATLTIELSDTYSEEAGTVILGVGPAMDPLEVPFTVDYALPDEGLLISPLDQSNNVGYDEELVWVQSADSYEVEILQVVDAEEVLIVSEITPTSSFAIRNLESNGKYKWRVRGINACGKGPFSEYFSFSTGNVTCSTNVATDLPILISTDLDTITSSIEILVEGSVIDVNIPALFGRHTFISDLLMRLTSPSGTTVELLSFACGSDDNFSIPFEDESSIINRPCPLSSVDPLRPNEPLSTFNGEPAKGIWTLTIIDDVREDGGSLEGWSLELCVAETVTPVREITLSPDFIEVCPKLNKASYQIDGTVSDGYQGDITFSIIEPLTQINITPNPLTGSGSRSFVLDINDPAVYPAGSLLLLIAADDNSADTMSIPVVDQEPTDKVSLLVPENNLVGVDLRADFSWLSSLDVNNYRFLLASDELMETIILDTVLTTESLELENKLEKDTDHFWTVTSLGLCNDVVSQVYSFRTTLISVVVDQTLGRTEVFPNPTSESITLVLPNDILTNDINYEIINTVGQVILSDKINKSSVDVDVSQLLTGMYFLRLSSSDGVWTQSIFKM